MSVPSLPAIALAACLCVGCAALTTSAPQVNYNVSETPKCSHNQSGIAVDVILGLIWGVSTVAVLGSSEPAAAVPLGVLTGLHGWSAVNGADNANKCQKAIKAHDAWLTQMNARRQQAAPNAPAAPTPVRAPSPTAATRASRPISAPAPLQGRWGRSPQVSGAKRSVEGGLISAPAPKPEISGAKRSVEGGLISAPSKVPLPGTGEWSQFWREVSP